MDVSQVAKIVAAVIKKLEPYDLVLCGRQAIDGDSAHMASINLSRVPRPYFNMGVGECVLTDTLTFPLIPNILFYCVQTVFTNR